MECRPLRIAGAYEIINAVHSDNRGEFAEWFRFDTVEKDTGYRFPVRQANVSRSARGVVRGIHYADIPPGQAKLVTCMVGRIHDIVVDIREGSETFGQWEAVELTGSNRKAVLLPAGVGHVFVALEEDSTVCYLVSDVYTPEREHGIHPLDPALAIDYSLPTEQLLLSPKDQVAPTLAEALAEGLLPRIDQKEPAK